MVEEEKIDLAIDYKRTFSTEHGKRVLEHLMIQGNVLTPVTGTDTNELLIMEGKRRLCLTILQNTELDIAFLKDSLKKMYEKQKEQMENSYV